MRKTLRGAMARVLACIVSDPVDGSIIVWMDLQSVCQLKRAVPRATNRLMAERTIHIAAPSDISGQALAKAVTGQGFACALAAEKTQARFVLSYEGRSFDIACPVKLGVVLAKVQGLVDVSGSQVLRAGIYTLDLLGKTWCEENGEAITLTDREVALLEALIHAPGHRLERAVLLEHVWGYHQDAETHTLETHIYRLRRKIEKDAGNPGVLLTDGAAYHLSV